jgi:hypothetical protein
MIKLSYNFKFKKRQVYEGGTRIITPIIDKVKTVKIKEAAGVITKTHKKIDKTHKKIDEAFNIIALNNTIIQSFLHDHSIAIVKYGQTLQLVQSDFLVASKILMLYRIVNYLINFRNPVSANVATYTTILSIIIFASEQFMK